ncbi:uncharacterized protein BDZ99DRAFT_521684 [Mytilinidion resinicola]|uniref:Uncharacterized protein n=1 Tax=Mytilinidion resinicola TaxID=574789 RepID=A0A6A6YK62_9PEZI|nr:uncharacterized protein BDZ99DRAFT_521684 [Mytilinidion resinicola]KAF2809242.1 hypothetical protein BDZ99DRAFT_521684 [Mytilinidion resinicola]
MHFIYAITALSAIFGLCLAMPHRDEPDLNTFSDSGNNWCLRGYYSDNNIGCTDHPSADWTPPYYTQSSADYCACHGIDADALGR